MVDYADALGQRLHGHGVLVVYNYANTVATQWLTMLTPCPHGQRLHGHGVGIVNNYEDTLMTTQTLFKNFEGFSQILKEQSGKKGIWVCLHIQ